MLRVNTIGGMGSVYEPISGLSPYCLEMNYDDDTPANSQMISTPVAGTGGILGLTGQQWTMSLWGKVLSAPDIPPFTPVNDVMVSYQQNLAGGIVNFAAQFGIHSTIEFGTNIIFAVLSDDDPDTDFNFWAASKPANQNQWYMLTMVFDGPANTCEFYVDGVEDSANMSVYQPPGVSTFTETATHFWDIGGYTTFTTYPTVDERLGTTNQRVHSLATWDSKLTAAEVLAIYNGHAGKNFELDSDSGGYVSSADLTMWHRYGLDATNLGRDYSAGGNHASVETNITVDDIIADAPA